MHHHNNRAPIFLLSFIASIIVAPSCTKANSLQNPVEEQKNFLTTVHERIKLKIVEEGDRNRTEQNKNEQAEQEARQSLEQTKREKQEAKQAVLEAEIVERSNQGGLFHRSDSFLKKVAFESKRETQAAEKQLMVLSDKERRLIAKVEALRFRRSEQQKVLEFIRQEAQQLAIIEQQIRSWGENPNTADYAEISQALITFARNKRLKTSVHFKSVNTSLQETGGATIKYQNPVQRKFEITRTVKCLTSCTEDLEVNDSYYIWTERNGRKTSDFNYRVSISKEREEVILKEDQK